MSTSPLCVLVILVFAATQLLARNTGLGMFIVAIGANMVASRFMGIRERSIKVFVTGMTCSSRLLA